MESDKSLFCSKFTGFFVHYKRDNDTSLQAVTYFIVLIHGQQKLRFFDPIDRCLLVD